MQETFSPELMQKKYESLPALVRSAIDSSDMGEVVESIGKENDLMLDQVDALGREVGYVMLGLVLTADFTDRLQKILGINSEKSYKIATEINSKIFDEIRSDLMKIQTQHTAEEIGSVGDFEIIEEKPPRTISSELLLQKNTWQENNGSGEIETTEKIGVVQKDMVQQMLNEPTGNVGTKTLIKEADIATLDQNNNQSQSTAESVEKMKYTVDPYREPTI